MHASHTCDNHFVFPRQDEASKSKAMVIQIGRHISIWVNFFSRICIMWNSIPDDIKLAESLGSFKCQLKAKSFKRLYNVFYGDDVRSFKITCPKCRRINSYSARTR